MKLVIASDIHGSEYWMKRVVEAFNNEKADMLLLLGDIYNHGPRNPLPKDYAPMKVAEILNSLTDKLMVVKGNCDSEVDQMISEFSFVNEAMVCVDGNRIYATHGHIFNKDHMPVNCGEVLVYGHFHVCFIERINGVVVANPGSAALPKQNTSHAYIVVENNKMQLKELESYNLIQEEQIKL